VGLFYMDCVLTLCVGGDSCAWVGFLFGGTPADVGGQPRRTQVEAVKTEAASRKTNAWVRWMTVMPSCGEPTDIGFRAGGACGGV
jgi:hypothetical protein